MIVLHGMRGVNQESACDIVDSCNPWYADRIQYTVRGVAHLHPSTYLENREGEPKNVVEPGITIKPAVQSGSALNKLCHTRIAQHRKPCSQILDVKDAPSPVVEQIKHLVGRGQGSNADIFRQLLQVGIELGSEDARKMSWKEAAIVRWNSLA